MATLTSTGLSIRTLAEILAEIEEDQRASPAFGTDFDTSAESVAGQLNAIVATKLRELEELIQAVYNARNPRGASYAALDILCALTGVTRLPATKGTVTLTLTLNAGASVPAGSIARVAGQPGNRWVTLAVATNPGGSPATVTVSAEAEIAGRALANAGTITEIATPVSGWTAVSNASDATPGRAQETDAALRVRRDRTVRAGGSSPLDAIRQALFAVTGVQQVSLFENDTDVTSGGMAPHSILAIVTGGTDQDVGSALWAAKAAGIYTNGTVTVNVVDDGGVSHAVRFSRPTTVDVYITVTLERDAATYAGDAAVETAIAAIGDALLAGDNVRKAAVTSAVMALAGVADVTSVLIGRSSANQFAANLAIENTEIADLDTARITVITAGVTP